MANPTDIEQAAANHPDVIAGMEDAKKGRTVTRTRPATADTIAPQAPRRQLRIDPQAATVLDNFATLNGLGFAPSVQEVLDAASDVACQHIATLYEAATSQMRTLAP